MDHPSKRNIARGQEGDVLTVSGLTRRIKSLLERQVGACWIRGEISNLRSVASGHHYFTLKDEGAQLSAVAFRGNAGAFLPILEEGRQVLAFGEVTVYEIRGNYQVIVRHLLEDGVGRLQQEFERLKQKLSSEGLFDEDRKKPIPAIPKKVAFLTSPTGAAVEDFRSILQNQGWPGEIYIIPSIVQGAEAPASLLAGLKLAGEIPGLELLVLGRGGGSLEDLVCFNDEALVRALSKFQLPTISAVGHEIDFVLTDFVADRRAETPTAAAGLILNNFLDFRQRTQNVHLRLRQLWKQNLSSLGRDLHHLMQRLQALRPKGFIENSFQRLDDLLNLLVISTQDGVREKNQLLQILLKVYLQIPNH